MKELHWSSKAQSDLVRLYEFLFVVNPKVAKTTLKLLSKKAEFLCEQPRIGEQLFQYAPKEVRKFIIGNYEMRYEITDDCIYILRIWHCKENR